MFEKEYYERIRKLYGYRFAAELKPLDFESFDNEKLNMARRRFSLHYNFDKWLSCRNNEQSVISTGIGLSGPPHIGTIYQIMNAIFLQKCGYRVQFVLGDLDSYNARNKDLDFVRALALRYRAFIKKLGFSDDLGKLRNQYDAYHPLRTMYLLSKYTEDNEVLHSLEDSKNVYIKKGIISPSRNALRLKLSILLMTGDFLDLAISDSFSNIGVTLGIDEHKYVKLAERIALKWNIKTRISGIYSWMIKGLNNYPKMSKSIPASSITAEDSYEEVRQKILQKQPEKVRNPFFECSIYQMMCAISSYSEPELNELSNACIENGAKWKKKKIEFLDTQVMPILERWKY